MVVAGAVLTLHADEINGCAVLRKVDPKLKLGGVGCPSSLWHHVARGRAIFERLEKKLFSARGVYHGVV